MKPNTEMWPVLVYAPSSFSNMTDAAEDVMRIRQVVENGDAVVVKCTPGTATAVPTMAVAMNPKILEINVGKEDRMACIGMPIRELGGYGTGYVRFYAIATPNGGQVSILSFLDIRSEEEFWLQATVLGCLMDPTSTGA